MSGKKWAKTTIGVAHIGRRFSGPDSLSYACDCPKQPCGLTIFMDWVPGCRFHQPTSTIRQGHAAEDCPGHEEQADPSEPQVPWWV